MGRVMTKFCSWGHYPPARHLSVERLPDRFATLPPAGASLLPYGNGRSYGDVCLNDGGRLLHTRGLDRFIAFDELQGVLRCEAGITLAEILRFALPRGWFLPVTPGTSHVTLGGAIANDVHGKNHLRMGSFGRHVRAFELLRSDGSRRLCTPDEQADWFAATVGGLGLTGIITWAEIALRPVAGPWLESETIKFGCLDEYFPLCSDSAESHEYRVAWFDCVARGPALGRGLFIRANHARPEVTMVEPKEQHWGLPFTPPLSLINKFSLRAFNACYWHRQRQPVSHHLTHYRSYFYPLDGLAHWNRLYGPRGFMQFQCVIPDGAAEEAVAELLKLIADSGNGSFLAVLKPFGSLSSPGLLSFPRHGTTLALDFPNRGPATLALLGRLEEVTMKFSGALYPAKDACMSGVHFRQAYPSWERFTEYVDPQFSSGFWRRVMDK